MAENIFDKLKDKVVDKVVGTAQDLEIGEDGKLDMNDAVTLLLKCEKAAVDREAFLREYLKDSFPEEVIAKAVSSTPLEAGITPGQLEEISEKVIIDGREATKQTPVADALTDTVDTIREEKKISIKGLKQTADDVSASLVENTYKRELLKTAQKLLYLYGLPQIVINENGTIHTFKARNLIMLSYATMYGTPEADKLLRAMVSVYPRIPESEQAAINIDRQTLDEVIKEWRKKFVGAQAISTAAGSNPLASKLMQTGLTGKKFEPFMHALKDALTDTALSNPDHTASEAEKKISGQLG